MNSLKQILAAILLTLTIGIPALASSGDVSTPTFKDPPPATCSNCDSSYEIQVQSSDATSSAETKGLETPEFAVDLLLALLSLF